MADLFTVWNNETKTVDRVPLQSRWLCTGCSNVFAEKLKKPHVVDLTYQEDDPIFEAYCDNCWKGVKDIYE